jgi:hypothetical protein
MILTQIVVVEAKLAKHSDAAQFQQSFYLATHLST